MNTSYGKKCGECGYGYVPVDWDEALFRIEPSARDAVSCRKLRGVYKNNCPACPDFRAAEQTWRGKKCGECAWYLHDVDDATHARRVEQYGEDANGSSCRNKAGLYVMLETAACPAWEEK